MGGGRRGPLVVLAGGGYASWRAYTAAPLDTSLAGAGAGGGNWRRPAMQSRLALASASLQARNYRAAVAYADEVLAMRSDARRGDADPRRGTRRAGAVRRGDCRCAPAHRGRRRDWRRQRARHRARYRPQRAGVVELSSRLSDSLVRATSAETRPGSGQRRRPRNRRRAAKAAAAKPAPADPSRHLHAPPARADREARSAHTGCPRRRPAALLRPCRADTAARRAGCDDTSETRAGRHHRHRRRATPQRTESARRHRPRKRMRPPFAT